MGQAQSIGNMFQFQGNLTWWTKTSSLVSFLQDNRKLKFMNEIHSKLKMQLFGTEPKCRAIVTGFEHYSSTCSQLVPISLLCVGISAGSSHKVQSTCWRFSKALSAAHPSILHIPSMEMFEHPSLLPCSVLGETGCCSFGKQLCPCHWSSHPLSLNASLTWGTATPAAHENSSGLCKEPAAPSPQHDPGRASTAAMSPNSHSSVPASVRSFYSALKRYNRDTLALLRAAQASSSSLLKHGHASSHHTNPPSLQG